MTRQTRVRVTWFIGCFLVVSCFVLFVSVVLRSRRSQPVASVSPVIQKQETKPASDGDLVSKMLFLGDVFWGRSGQRTAQASKEKYGYFTRGLDPNDRASYDAWIANFECPITTKDVPYEQQLNQLRFNCRPEYLPDFAKWFTAGSLSNNHTMNNDGVWGLEQSRTNLDQAGIQYFGNYDMIKTDDICEVVTLPAQTSESHKKVSLPVALCGYMLVVNVAPSEAQLAVMKKYAEVMPVIAMPHMGVEYLATAEAQKVAAYRAMIDNGADAVMGAHPHVIQNSESYKGHLIAYSLGNFLFDQQTLGTETSTGLGVGIALRISDEAAAKAYQKVAPGCSKYKDDCLAQLKAALPKRPVIKVAYNFACYDQSTAVGGVPALGSEAVCNKAFAVAGTKLLTSLSLQW